MSDHLTTYTATLATSTPDPAPKAKPATPSPDEWRERNRPLIDRLRDLLATIPDEVITDGLALRALQIRLRGRKGRMCHHSELADALRQLGFTRRRGWSDSRGGFAARWFLAKPING